MITLSLVPLQGKYGLSEGKDVLRAETQGGPPRVRRDMDASDYHVKVGWELDATDYQTLRTFYKTTTHRGALLFQMDLVTDYDGLTTHLCRFVPGSLKLDDVNGQLFSASAELVVRPIAPDGTADAALVASVTAGGIGVLA